MNISDIWRRCALGLLGALALDTLYAAPPAPQQNTPSINRAERSSESQEQQRTSGFPNEAATTERSSSDVGQETPRSLTRMAVIGVDGETIGRVESVMRDKRTQDPVLIVITNDSQRMAVELGQVQVDDRQLHLNSPLSDDAKQERINAFDSRDLAPVDHNTRLARLAEH